MWCFLAGRERQLKRRSNYWAKRYSQSVAVKYGIGISQFTKWLAATIDDIDLQHLEIEKELFSLMREIVTANLKPYIDGEQLTNQLQLMETMFNASWNSNVQVKSLNKNQVQRKFGKLIIGKTTGYTARWLYRLLQRYC